MASERFPKAIRHWLNRFGLGSAPAPEETDVVERVRTYEAMPALPPLFETETAPEPPAIQESPRLRRYFESLRELAHAISSLFDRDDVSQANLFALIDKMLARKFAEMADLAPPIMGVLADSPDWRERRWAMQALVKIARLQPEMAGTFVPGFLIHLEAPSSTEADLTELAEQPSRERLAREFGFGDAVKVTFELPIPAGEHLRDVALEGLDQLSLITPDFAMEAFAVLEALSDEPTKAGEWAGNLLERMGLDERMRRMVVTDDFLAALHDPYVIAVAKGKRYHLGHCRFVRTAAGKDVYLFVNPQEAVEFGFKSCHACHDE